MRSTAIFSAVAATVLLATTGCRVFHHEETAGQYVDDTTLTARAKAALIKDKEVNSSDYSVEVYQGHVTLSGVAKNAAEAKRAEQDIRKLPGVKSVENDVRIASAANAATPR
jgi:hyperosmotically inducible periplasmic protein